MNSPLQANSEDSDGLERLSDRAVNGADSTLWTYKAHFEAADSYSRRSRFLDIGTTAGAALVTTALVWNAFPNLTVGLAILTAVAAGYKTATNPQKKAEANYRAGEAYHKLLNEYRDFITLDLPDDSATPEELRGRYDDLETRRRELNDDMPNLHRKWYDRLDDSIYGEIETTDKAQTQLTKGYKPTQSNAD
jgi:hypothetical protein